MNNFTNLKNTNLKILSLGNHPKIIQSILDFDYLCGKEKASVQAIIQSKSGKKFSKLFFGNKEVLLPIFESVKEARDNGIQVELFMNLNSGRRCVQSTIEFFENYPDAIGGHLFAEDTPEKHSIELYEKFGKEKIIAGPSGVGILIPGFIKLGAIGGTDIDQLLKNKLWEGGDTFVISASGGMAIEIVNTLINKQKSISAAFTIGGDRFPVNTLSQVFLYAQNDPSTENIVYYGELGGEDEYEIIKLIKEGKITKKIICFIAGIVAEAFDKPTQFGHAKALASSNDESARAKKIALKEAGVYVGENFTDFLNLIETQIKNKEISTPENITERFNNMRNRTQTLFTSHISSEGENGYKLLGKDLDKWIQTESISNMIISSFLGHETKSPITQEFMEVVIKTFFDHGPQVSGAMNTIISARAGKDLVSSVASGILTIGPRFGGATNDAAKIWFGGVSMNQNPETLVENFSKEKTPIMGIGHLKYRLGMPDPRVEHIKSFALKLSNHKYLDFALEIEKITSSKKGNLILNVDGVVAALMLDMLAECENYSQEKLKELIDIEFFNALFLISRIMGFTAHYLDQRRNDEGLFRLPSELVSLRKDD